MGKDKSRETQLAERERIIVPFRDDTDARLAALRWLQNRGIPGWERRLSQAASAFVLALFAGAAAAALVAAFDIQLQLALAVGAMLAVFAWYGWSAWSASLTRRLSAAFDTEAWGDTSYRFDADGFALEDALRHWRTGWRGVSRVSAEPKGLFVATKGIVFYLPAGSWPDAAAMQADTARIEAWWRAATGAAA